MGCTSSKVREGPEDYTGPEDAYLDPNNYDDLGAVCQSSMGDVTYSKPDSDEGVFANEHPTYTSIQRRAIVVKSYLAHGINSDAEQFTEAALAEAPRISKKEAVTVTLWIDDILQCALLQHIANNPKKAHPTLRGIAASANFRCQLGHTISWGASPSTQSLMGVTDESRSSQNASTPEIIVAGSNYGRFSIKDEAKSGSSSASMRKERSPKESRTSLFERRSSRTNCSYVASEAGGMFDVRKVFAPLLSSVIEMNVILIVLNNLCQAANTNALLLSSARTAESGPFMGASTSSEGSQLPHGKAVSIDMRENCLRYQYPSVGTRVQAPDADVPLGRFILSDLSAEELETAHHTDINDSSTPRGQDEVEQCRAVSEKTNDHGIVLSPLCHTPQGQGRQRMYSPERSSSCEASPNAPHLLTIPAAPPEERPRAFSTAGSEHKSPMSPDGSALWKERTLTADALKTFLRYHHFLQKQRKEDDEQYDRSVLHSPPTLRVFAFGSIPCSRGRPRPGTVPPPTVASSKDFSGAYE